MMVFFFKNVKRMTNDSQSHSSSVSILLTVTLNLLLLQNSAGEGVLFWNTTSIYWYLSKMEYFIAVWQTNMQTDWRTDKQTARSITIRSCLQSFHFQTFFPKIHADRSVNLTQWMCWMIQIYNNKKSTDRHMYVCRYPQCYLKLLHYFKFSRGSVTSFVVPLNSILTNMNNI